MKMPETRIVNIKKQFKCIFCAKLFAGQKILLTHGKFCLKRSSRRSLSDNPAPVVEDDTQLIVKNVLETMVTTIGECLRKQSPPVVTPRRRRKSRKMIESLEMTFKDTSPVKNVEPLMFMDANPPVFSIKSEPNSPTTTSHSPTTTSPPPPAAVKPNNRRGSSCREKHSFVKKAKVIAEVEGGMEQDAVAQKYFINRSLISKWMKDRDRIKEAAASKISESFKLRPSKIKSER